jgi:hypothetical protein
MGCLLWLLGLVLIIVGAIELLGGEIILGAILILIGLVLGARGSGASYRRRRPI